MRRTLLLACAAFCWTDCLEPTEVMTTITTNAKCSDVREVSLMIGRLDQIDAPPGMSTTTTKACDPATGRIGSIVLVPTTSSEPAAIRVVMGLGGKSADDCVASGYKGGCIVARRAVRYVKHSRLELPIPMQLECVDVPCGATTTCVNGNCVPAMIDQCDPDAGCVPDGGPIGTVARAIGGTDIDVVMAMARDGMGNVHVSGQFGGNAEFGGVPVMGIGTNSIFAASYAPTLALRWQTIPKTESGAGAGQAIAVGSTSVVGGFVSSVDFGLGAISGVGGFMLGVDPASGAALAQRSYPGAGTSVAHLAFDGQGNLYAVGTCVSTTIGSLTCGTTPQGFLTSFDASGTERWMKTFGNANVVGAADSASIEGNHVVVVGSVTGAFDFGGGLRGGAGGSDAFVASYTTSGQHEWSRTIGDGQLQNASRVTTDASYVYATGAFMGSLSDKDTAKTITANGVDGFLWVLALSTGVGHDLRRLPGVTVNGSAVDQAGTLHMCGGFSGQTDLGSGMIAAAGPSDGLLASVDAGGTTKVLTFGGPGNDACNAMAVDSPQAVYIGGVFEQSMNIAGVTLASHGKLDGFIARIAR